MQTVAAVFAILVTLAVAYRTFLRCARIQSASFRDRVDPHRKIAYQALPGVHV